MLATKSRMVFALLLIGWKSGAFSNQSQSVVKQTKANEKSLLIFTLWSVLNEAVEGLVDTVYLGAKLFSDYFYFKAQQFINLILVMHKLLTVSPVPWPLQMFCSQGSVFYSLSEF